MAALAAAQAAAAVHVEVAHALVILGARERNEQQERVHLLLVPLRGEQLQRIRRPVDPQIVAVDREERVAVDQRRGLDQPAARFHEQRPLVGNDDLQAMLAAGEVRFDRIGEIMDVDHRLPHAGGAQMLEHMVEQRLAGDLDQRLGPGRGQRPHPLAQPGGHDHRRVRHLGRHFGAQAQGAAGLAHAAAFHGSRRCSGPMLESNQSRTGLKCGSARSRSSRPHMRGWKRR